MSFTEWLDRNRDQVRELAIQHADLCLTAVVVAGLLGVALGVLAHRSRLATAAAQAGTSVVFTVPSLALVGLLIPVTGLTRDTVLVMLVLYALVLVLLLLAKAGHTLGLGRAWESLHLVQRFPVLK